MIPKVIHYCWFGDNPYPEVVKECMQSWKAMCPDYEIRCWNEENFDYKSCNYAREAYDVQKWAFVSDYARLKILEEYGGVYVDTDVVLEIPQDIIGTSSYDYARFTLRKIENYFFLGFKNRILHFFMAGPERESHVGKFRCGLLDSLYLLR